MNAPSPGSRSGRAGALAAVGAMRAIGAMRPLAALLLAAVASCDFGGASVDDEPYDPPVAFGSGRVRLETSSDTVTMDVEIAATPDQRGVGLMERRQLPAGEGMLFTYPDAQPPDAGFWMFRTRIPLDIAFLDREGRIVAIRRMEPCESPNPRFCPSYEPGKEYWSALEANRGFFERHGAGIGDRVVVEEGG